MGFWLVVGSSLHQSTQFPPVGIQFIAVVTVAHLQFIWSLFDLLFVHCGLWFQRWSQGSSGTLSSFSSNQVAPILPFITANIDKEVKNSPSWTALAY